MWLKARRISTVLRRSFFVCTRPFFYHWSFAVRSIALSWSGARPGANTNTLNPGAGGPRFPPAAPQARDESAISRVSNYSIRPCIHDAQLSARFGAKAACRAPASAGGGGGGGQGHPSVGGGGVGGGLGAASRGGSGTVSAAGSDAGERPFDAGVEGSTAPTARRENSRGKGSQTKVPKVRVASGGQGA